jgi:hypothetical protein
MSYYMGDFYRGDFYRGDPGFFGTIGHFLGGVAKSAVGLIPGVGPIAQRAMTTGTLASRASTAVGRITSQGVAAVRGHPVLSAAGAAGVIGGALGAGGGMMAAAPGVAMKGYHLSKYRKGGKAPHMVKNRHMRVTNVRALRRSLRRIHGFSRIARKVIHIAHPPRGTRVRFKFRRKKRA